MAVSVWSAADVTFYTLRELGMTEVCFIGSLAARLYGNDREPNVSAGPPSRTRPGEPTAQFLTRR